MSRYLTEFVRCARGADMLRRKLFPNAKEITESFGAYNAVRAHLPGFVLGDPSVTMIAVGDGHAPRTAATFAYRTAWRCWSVDPLMRSLVWDVERLDAIRARAEDVRVGCRGPVVIVAVHSHARLHEAVKVAVTNPGTQVAVVAIPCCVPQVLHGMPPDVEYEDPDIMSPERRVLVWRDVSEYAGRMAA